MGIILVMVIFFIAIGINALVAIVTMSISLFRSAGILWYHTIPITIGICFLPSIIRYIRAIFSRLHFSRKFRSYCKKYKIHLKTHHPALLSLFVKYKSLDYSMLIDQKEYTLKFFPGNTLKRVLHFDGLSKSESSKFYTMPVMLHNWYLYAMARKLLKGNMFQFLQEYNTEEVA